MYISVQKQLKKKNLSIHFVFTLNSEAAASVRN